MNPTPTSRTVTVMGSYVADLAFRIDRLPAWGETLMGQSFQLGPGGKGSNQAVAAARAGAHVSFISKLGPDPFGEIARTLYRNEGIDTRFIFSTPNPTGAAVILIDAAKGENAIVVVPGACFELTPAEVDQATSAHRRIRRLRHPTRTLPRHRRARPAVSPTPTASPQSSIPPRPPHSPKPSTLSATTSLPTRPKPPPSPASP